MAARFRRAFGSGGFLGTVAFDLARGLTHSPVLAALPGARILELDEHGIHERAWEDLEVVYAYRHFLREPRRYLRHVVEE